MASGQPKPLATMFHHFWDPARVAIHYITVDFHAGPRRALVAGSAVLPVEVKPLFRPDVLPIRNVRRSYDRMSAVKTLPAGMRTGQGSG